MPLNAMSLKKLFKPVWLLIFLTRSARTPTTEREGFLERLFLNFESMGHELLSFFTIRACLTLSQPLYVLGLKCIRCKKLSCPLSSNFQALKNLRIFLRFRSEEPYSPA